MTEMDKLEKYLEDNGYEYERGIPLAGGDQIIVMSEGKRIWDAVCHHYSYGGDEGLLETYGTIVDEESAGDEVEGWLTAEDVISRMKGGTEMKLLTYEDAKPDWTGREINWELFLNINQTYFRSVLKVAEGKWPV